MEINIPGDIWEAIARYCDFPTLLSLRSTCSSIRRRVLVKSIPDELHFKLNDKNLSLFPQLRVLYANCNPAIADDSVMKLPYLTSLSADYNPNITDVSVDLLPQLTYLDASYNPNITDASVSKLTQLTTLYAVRTGTLRTLPLSCWNNLPV